MGTGFLLPENVLALMLLPTPKYISHADLDLWPDLQWKMQKAIQRLFERFHGSYIKIEIHKPATSQRIDTQTTASTVTYDHRLRKIGHPVRSAVLKPQIGGLVVGWVTTSESPLLYV